MWRVPPTGSAGDAWDALLEVPSAVIVNHGATARRGNKARARKAKDLKFVPWTPRLHPLTLASLICLVLAAASTGPAAMAIPAWLVIALFSAAGAIVLMRYVQTDYTGEKVAWVCGAVAALFLATSTLISGNRAVRAFYFEENYALIARLETPGQGKTEYVLDLMRLMADRIALGQLVADGPLTARGSASINRPVPPQSNYSDIITVALEIPIAAEIDGLSENLRPRALPRDPFADHPDAYFGAWVGAQYIVVFSAGPDGEWSINPRNPIPSHIAEDDIPEYVGQFYLGHPGLPEGSGDLFYVRPTLLGAGEWTDTGALMRSVQDRSRRFGL